MKELATMIKTLRTAKGWSQDILAEKADVKRATIAKIETGKSDGNPDTLMKLATAFGVTVELLLSGTGVSGSITQKGHGNAIGSQDVTTHVNTSSEEVTKLRIQNEMLKEENTRLIELIKSMNKR